MGATLSCMSGDVEIVDTRNGKAYHGGPHGRRHGVSGKPGDVYSRRSVEQYLKYFAEYLHSRGWPMDLHTWGGLTALLRDDFSRDESRDLRILSYSWRSDVKEILNGARAYANKESGTHIEWWTKAEERRTKGSPEEEHCYEEAVAQNITLFEHRGTRIMATAANAAFDEKMYELASNDYVDTRRFAFSDAVEYLHMHITHRNRGQALYAVPMEKHFKETKRELYEKYRKVLIKVGEEYESKYGQRGLDWSRR